jgi:hypothetical protein
MQVGAWLVETRIGKRWALAGSTFFTAVLCAAFVHARSPLAVRLSTVGISLTSTVSFFVLCVHVLLLRCGLDDVGGVVWVSASEAIVVVKGADRG